MKKNDDFTINSKDIEAKESLNNKNNFIKNFFKDWILPICAALIIAVLINKFIFFNIKIVFSRGVLHSSSLKLNRSNDR